MTGTQLQQKFPVIRMSHFSINCMNILQDLHCRHCKAYLWCGKQVTALASTQVASNWLSTDAVQIIAAKKHHVCCVSNACVLMMSNVHGLTQSSSYVQLYVTTHSGSYH